MNKTYGRLALILCLAGAALVVVGPRFSSAQATPVVGATPAVADLITEGEGIFNSTCIACHQAGGKGVKGVPGSAPTYNGAIPPLANSPFESLQDPTAVIMTVLNGRAGMPSFSGAYSDEQVAAVITYVRQAFGNKAGPVTPEEVAAVRKASAAPPLPATPIASGTPVAIQGLGN